MMSDGFLLFPIYHIGYSHRIFEADHTLKGMVPDALRRYDLLLQSTGSMPWALRNSLHLTK